MSDDGAPGDAFVPATEIPDALDGERIDRVVAMLTGCSRSEATALVDARSVLVGGRVVDRSSHRVRAGDVVQLHGDPVRPPLEVLADPSVDFAVVYVDDDIIVVDKPPGLVVHPGAGHQGGTLVHGLVARFPELATVGQPERPGLVHRLDRGTSGLLVVARTSAAHTNLVEQLTDHSVERVYAALVYGHPQHQSGMIDAPIGRSRRDPLRMTVSESGRAARTRYRVGATFHEPVPASMVTCWLETGRTHQIRVHLASIGHPVVGDEKYGGNRRGVPSARPVLHAQRLSFRHPGTGATVEFESSIPDDLRLVIDSLS
ncbi:MAG: RluA family pseudouridine synthase [Actinomycetes bacterium]